MIGKDFVWQIGVTLLLAIYGTLIFNSESDIKSLTIQQSLEITASRQREEGLLKFDEISSKEQMALLTYCRQLSDRIKLLDYQIDVLAQKDLK